MENKVVDILNKRIASRAIKTDPLDDNAVRTIAEAAWLAPSCFNNQPWRYIFMTGNEALEKGREALGGVNDWAKRAPLLIAGYASKPDDCVLKDGRYYYQFDLGLSVMCILLAATEMGLTARPMAGYKPDVIKKNFNLSESDEVLIMIAIGKPDSDESYLPEEKRGLNEKPRVRRDISETIRLL